LDDVNAKFKVFEETLVFIEFSSSELSVSFIEKDFSVNRVISSSMAFIVVFNSSELEFELFKILLDDKFF